MVGLGETDEEILEVMRDLRAHGVDMLTIGQYLQPLRASPAGAALRRARGVRRCSSAQAQEMGFTHAACGPMVRSSYHADQQFFRLGGEKMNDLATNSL